MSEAVPLPPLSYTRVEIRTPLITLADAKDQLRVRDALHDAEIGRVVLDAQNAILAYLTVSADPAWTEQTLPLHVRAAILKLLTNLWVHRGDETASESGADVWAEIDQLLATSRDPVVW